MKVAIVHDYLNQAGGAERVLAVLHRMFPDAPIFTTLFDPRAVGLPLAKADVRVSWMQGLPKWKRNFRHYMPLYPFAVRSFDLRGYDVVITSSSAFAKGVRVPPSALHLCYCYTPMRWAWSFDRYVDGSSLSPSARMAARLTIPALRRWDTATARNVDRFVAISTEVAQRIRAHLWARERRRVPAGGRRALPPRSPPWAITSSSSRGSTRTSGSTSPCAPAPLSACRSSSSATGRSARCSSRSPARRCASPAASPTAR